LITSFFQQQWFEPEILFFFKASLFLPDNGFRKRLHYPGCPALIRSPSTCHLHPGPDFFEIDLAATRREVIIQSAGIMYMHPHKVFVIPLICPAKGKFKELSDFLDKNIS
jgi:hypothetical protein